MPGADYQASHFGLVRPATGTRHNGLVAPRHVIVRGVPLGPPEHSVARHERLARKPICFLFMLVAPAQSLSPERGRLRTGIPRATGLRGYDSSSTALRDMTRSRARVCSFSVCKWTAAGRPSANRVHPTAAGGVR